MSPCTPCRTTGHRITQITGPASTATWTGLLPTSASRGALRCVTLSPRWRACFSLCLHSLATITEPAALTTSLSLFLSLEAQVSFSRKPWLGHPLFRVRMKAIKEVSAGTLFKIGRNGSSPYCTSGRNCSFSGSIFPQKSTADSIRWAPAFKTIPPCITRASPWFSYLAIANVIAFLFAGYVHTSLSREELTIRSNVSDYKSSCAQLGV